jgi:hypothetical protein
MAASESVKLELEDSMIVYGPSIPLGGHTAPNAASLVKKFTKTILETREVINEYSRSNKKFDILNNETNKKNHQSSRCVDIYCNIPMSISQKLFQNVSEYIGEHLTRNHDIGRQISILQNIIKYNDLLILSLDRYKTYGTSSEEYICNIERFIELCDPTRIETFCMNSTI